MKIKNALKRFAYETFRPHSKEEYAELFTRGRGGDEKTPYPWFYARVFLIGLLLFTFICVGYSASKLNFLMVAAAGAFFADLTFIVLLVEIYPKRDMPLLTPIFALFAGGILSSGFIYILYGIASYDAPFVDQAWTAFVEETGKALITIIILLILKKRNPFECLIIGAAVGGGYSAFENMWFMYTYGFGWSGLSQAIETGLWRALGTPFSHATWAGAFGWALSYVKQPQFRRWYLRYNLKSLLNWRPFAVYLFNYTMHFFVNFPLMEQFAGWKGYPISAVTGILSIAFIIILIVRCRRSLAESSLSSGMSEQMSMWDYPKINGFHLQASGGYSETGGSISRYAFIANVLAAAAIFCFSFTLLGPTCVFGGYMNYKTYYYDNWQNVLSIVQGGREFNPDYEREYVEYDSLSENFSYTWTDGELISVIQRQRYGNYYYRFTYGYTTYNINNLEKFTDENGDIFVRLNGKEIPVGSNDGILPSSVKVWELKTVALELNDSLYYPRTIMSYGSGSYTGYADSAPSPDSIKTYRYFLLTSSVSYVNVRSDGTFEVDLRESVSIRETESVVFSTIFFAAFLGCGITYFVYKSKIRRLKDVER